MMRVSWIYDSPTRRRPNLPDGWTWTRVDDNGDGTCNVVASPPPGAETLALKKATRVAVAPRLAAGEMTQAELADVAPVFDPWETATAYATGDVVSYDGSLWECRQGHTSQPDWTPDAVLALWQRYRGSDEPAEVTAWAPATPYAVDERVTYNGTTYRCLQAHTSQTGWEPPNVPALWAAE